MASHEFRTPLSIIDGSAQFLAAKGDDLTTDYLIKRTGKIRKAVQRMTRLMESTLTAASMQDGKIAIEVGQCDLANIITEVCTRQQELSKDHVISCNVAHLPAAIQADPGSLEQVLTNLLSNAVKYAPGAPRIDVVACAEGEEVVIAVRDHGLGIDEDDLPNMFERFFRAKTSTGITGTGIGLNLVKTLVEMHGGSISVETGKGAGSTFMVRLPIAGPEGVQLSETKVA
jgi:signal transduction histidine kinase